MTVPVRRASGDDWMAYRDLRLRALAETPWAYGSTLEREQGFSEETWRSRLTTNLTFVAGTGDRLVGTATGYVDPEGPVGTVSLVAMYVEPGTRGSGCAHALIEAVVRASEEVGARRVRLDVTADNTRAARCYRRYGFTVTGRKQTLPRSPEVTEVEMALELG